MPAGSRALHRDDGAALRRSHEPREISRRRTAVTRHAMRSPRFLRPGDVVATLEPSATARLDAIACDYAASIALRLAARSTRDATFGRRIREQRQRRLRVSAVRSVDTIDTLMLPLAASRGLSLGRALACIVSPADRPRGSNDVFHSRSTRRHHPLVERECGGRRLYFDRLVVEVVCPTSFRDAASAVAARLAASSPAAEAAQRCGLRSHL